MDKLSTLERYTRCEKALIRIMSLDIRCMKPEPIFDPDVKSKYNNLMRAATRTGREMSLYCQELPDEEFNELLEDFDVYAANVRAFLCQQGVIVNDGSY